jgi:hypothetical protein
MTVKAMVLQDLPGLYPGLTRAGVERVFSTLDAAPSGGGQAMASQLIAIAPDIAARVNTLHGPELDGYVDAMKSAAVLVLRMWSSNDKAPTSSAIVAGVEAIRDPSRPAQSPR